MANTYGTLFIHLIFAPKNRESLLPATIRQKVYSYIGGVIKSEKQKLIAIGGIDNHIHILVGITPSISLPDFVRTIKSNTSRYINANRLLLFKFEWQRGYAAFSYSRSQIETVINYIEHQPEHHKNTTFHDELTAMLEKYDTDFDPAYLLSDIHSGGV